MAPCCRSCGDTHMPAAGFCPRTGDPVDSGPCGTTLDRYEVETLLGNGGMGAVYRARHVMLAQPVALKLLRAQSPELLERFVREARAAAAIGSPHIVRVTDFGVTTAGQAFLAMELLEGQDLDQLLHAHGALPVRRAVDITKQVLAGLTAAHAAGIVHRDLKPGNVFLVGDVVKLLDFGVSKMKSTSPVDSLTRTGAVMGTPQFMAPEQFRASRDVDHRADLYSVAVTIYQMLSGKVPFAATTYETLILQVCTEDPVPLRTVAPHVPPPLARVIEQGMAREPSARWQSAGDFSRALDAATREIEAALTPGLAKTMLAVGTPDQGIVKRATRRRRWIPIAGVVLAVACAGVFWLASRGSVQSAATEPAPEPARAAAQPSDAGTAPAASAVTASDAAPVAVLVPAAADAATALTPTAVASGKPPPARLSKKPPPPAAKGIVVSEPRIVGDLSGAPLRAAIAAARADLEECRRDRAETVEVQFHVHTKIGLAAPAPDNKGSEEVARCVANRIKEHSRPWPEGTSGILVLVVFLPARG